MRIIYLPHGEDGSKTGLDDFLAAGHSREELLALSSDVLRPIASDPKPEGAPKGPLLSTAELLAQVGAVIERYVRLPSRSALLAISLYVLHTWAFDAAHATPYLLILSPTKRSGKTRLQEVLELLVYKPWRIAAASEAAMFRKIASERPTLLLDELDALWGSRSERSEGIRGLLNAGNRPGACVPRCVGEGSKQETVDFPTYSAKILAGIATGRWPDTILDRSIRITLARRTRQEPVARFRHRKAQAETEALRTALAVWAAEHTTRLCDAEPELPDALDDRLAEGWEALLAIADLAGGELAQQAREATINLASETDEDGDTDGVLLLQALHPIFGDERAVATEKIIQKLNSDDELPFGGYRKGAGLDSRGLAKLLKPFGVRPRDVRIGEAKAKGYKREWLVDLWERYCPQYTKPPSAADRSATSATTASQSQKSETGDPRQDAAFAEAEHAANPPQDRDVA